MAFDQAKAQAICERLSEGETLVEICAKASENGEPAIRTVYDWMDENKPFAADVARARKIGHDTIAERTRLVARGKDGSTADVTRDRLIVDTDLKLLSKWDSRRYGDKLAIDADVRTQVTIHDPTKE